MAAVTGINAKVTSWANHTSLVTTGSGSTGTEAFNSTLNIVADGHDVTTYAASGASAMSNITGLKSWSGTITQYINPAAIGSEGLVTYAAGYVVNAKSWTLTINVNTHDVTDFNSSGVTWRDFITGLYGWGGSYAANVDGTTAVSLPGGTSSDADAEFKIKDHVSGTADHVLQGNIITTQTGLSLPVSGLAEVTYNYTGNGALEIEGDGDDTTIFADLDDGGTPNVFSVPAAGELVLQAASSRTYTGNAMVSSIQLTVNVGDPIQIVTNFQGTSTLTIA